MNDSVKKFYNMNPYPDFSRLARIYMPPKFFENNCKTVNKPVVNNPEILIAGCGTVAAGAISKLYPEAKLICAIDFSEKTIEIAKKNAGKKNAAKIKWVVADLADKKLVNKLPSAQFDWIHCTGVLHHLNDPEQGIINLSKLLKTNGILRFQFYSKGARALIEFLRQAVISQNIHTEKEFKTIFI